MTGPMFFFFTDFNVSNIIVKPQKTKHLFKKREGK